jgi:hypothetical protein
MVDYISFSALNCVYACIDCAFILFPTSYGKRNLTLHRRNVSNFLLRQKNMQFVFAAFTPPIAPIFPYVICSYCQSPPHFFISVNRQNCWRLYWQLLSSNFFVWKFCVSNFFFTNDAFIQVGKSTIPMYLWISETSMSYIFLSTLLSLKVWRLCVSWGTSC